jgi:radical SAM protein with 4Fe4S-binding SPASM domain
MRIRYRTPVTVFLNVTYRCNLSCVYCSANAAPTRRDELSAAGMRAILQELIACRVLRVVVTGGEPFVREDIFDVLAALREAHVAVYINTNGTLLDDDACARLAALRISRVSVSLDGPRHVNDATRGVGTFARITRGIGRLVSAGIRPHVLLTLTRRSVAALDETVDECRRLGAASVSINPLWAVGRGAGCYAALAVAPEELRTVADTVQRLNQRDPGFIQSGLGVWEHYPAAARRVAAAEAPQERWMLPCDAAKAFCAIAADGSVMPCNKFEGYTCGNLTEQSLREIWDGEPMERVRSLASCRVKESGTCAACTYNRVCSGGCRAQAYNAYHDLRAPDPACAVLPGSAIHSLSVYRHGVPCA